MNAGGVYSGPDLWWFFLDQFKIIQRILMRKNIACFPGLLQGWQCVWMKGNEESWKILTILE